MRVEQRATIADLALEVMARGSALARKGSIRFENAGDGSSVEIEGSARGKCQADAPGSSREMPIRIGLTFHANFAAGGFDPERTLGASEADVAGSGTDPSVARGNLLDFDAAAASAGNDFARYLRRADIAAPGFCVQALNRMDLQIP